MSALIVLAKIITFAACLALIAIVEPALNRCTRATRMPIFCALFLIVAGAVLLSASLIPGVEISPWGGTSALSTGAALILYKSQRRSVWP